MHLSSIGPVRGSGFVVKSLQPRGEQGKVLLILQGVSTHPNTSQKNKYGLYRGIALYQEYKKNLSTYDGSECGWSLGEGANFTFAEDLKIEFLGIIKLRKLFGTGFHVAHVIRCKSQFGSPVSCLAT